MTKNEDLPTTFIIGDENAANLYEEHGAKITHTAGEKIIAPNGEDYVLKDEEYRVVLPDGDLTEFWRKMNS